MEMKKNKSLLFIALSIILFGACTSEDNGGNSNPVAVAGVYSSDLLLATEQGGGSQVSTRGLDTGEGQFTNVYPYPYIYIHSADSKTNEGEHKYLKIPLKDVAFCDGCQGIHLEMEVLDESEGGGYIIKNENGESITLAAGEEVYFSTINSSFWKAHKLEEGSPETNSDVFIQDNEVNKELLRSVQTYSKEDLISLLSEAEPDIPMERHCTAFRVYFMFTALEEDYGGYIRNDNEWNELMGDVSGTYAPGNFYIKLYLGPNFTAEYDVYSNAVTKPDEAGFYVTNEQKYQPFEVSTYNTESGDDGSVSFRGYGYITDYSNYLIAPLNPNTLSDNFSVYAFVKYTPDITRESDDFLTSDEGAKWFKLEVPDMVLAMNRVHFIIMQIDLHSLDVFKSEGTSTDTRALKGLEEIKAEYKALNIVDRF